MQCWGTEDEDDGDPPRLWAPNAMFPGTAFTRSLGDTGAAWLAGSTGDKVQEYSTQQRMLGVLAAVAEDIGVIADPEVASVDISGDTPIIVLASDGVFEFMRDQVVVDLVSSHGCLFRQLLHVTLLELSPSMACEIEGGWL